MQNCWALMLVLGVVAATPTKHPRLSYKQVLASAIDKYNQELGSENAFRLLEAEPRPDWDPSAQTIQPLKFSIKETVCRADKNPDVTQCAEKEDGVDRNCFGFYSAKENEPVIMVRCEDVDQELGRIPRGGRRGRGGGRRGRGGRQKRPAGRQKRPAAQMV
ncbi:cathelicidin-2-like [Heteronotia binoei]|uniref:cathelicidin-2-like n=1 Tax=Heteronotia binoei TaxID=13085 RepID=UPI00292FC824|nr:cathelicidin-2-like [Heteronotia binoei]